MRITGTTLISLSLFALPLVSYAQNDAACAPLMPVTMTLSSGLTSTVPSASIGFHILMQNHGTKFLHDAILAVNVMQKGTGTVVDRFIASEAVGIFAESGTKADFIWKVPAGLPTDTYTVAAALVPSGTPRADIFSRATLPAALQDISISGGIPEAMISAVRVNGKAYQRSAAVRISEGNAQVVAATVNGTPGPYKGALTWRLYAADAGLGDAPIDTKVRPVELHPGLSADVSYPLTDTTRDGYYLEGELSDGRSSSYTDVWLARGDNVFPKLKCVGENGAPALPGTGDSNIVVGTVVALLALGGVWWLYEKRNSA